ISLEAQRQGIPALQQKDTLDKERSTLQQKLNVSATELLTESNHLQRNLRSARALSDLLAAPSGTIELPQLADMGARRAVRQVLDTSGGGDVGLTQLLQKALAGELAMLEKHLDDARRAQRAHVELTDYWQRREAQTESRRDLVANTHQVRRQRYES